MKAENSGRRSLVRAFILGVVLCGAVLPERALAQDGAERALQQIETAFSNGDSRVLADAAADRVEIRLFGSSTWFSRGQAVYVLEDFFRQYPPRKCAFKKSTQTDDSWFAPGEYWYETAGNPLRLYIVLRQKGEQWELREIRVEE